MIKVSTDSAIVVGDIAGRYNAFAALVAAHPGRLVVSVGDMIDRGHGNQQVLDWFMNNTNAIALQGNHELMAVDAHRDAAQMWNWQRNGGATTLRSFGGTIPANYLEWMTNLPRCMALRCNNEDFFISHAFYRLLHLRDPEPEDEQDLNFVWDRAIPQQCDRYRLHIAGHDGLYNKTNNGVCVDDSHNSRVGAMLLPECEFVAQRWLPEDYE